MEVAFQTDVEHVTAKHCGEYEFSGIVGDSGEI